ncbi:alpha/beta hydrolase family protein [Pseudomonas maioricensis]|uniref:alpha/beta hydrolase family protein n=1 Tax=Pseudomonas maioricensis TaxID=1766623 RepID=UPI001FAC5DDB
MSCNPLRVASLLLVWSLSCSAFALNGDPRPDAPELAARGAYQVGVRTIDVIHRDQLNILAATSTDSNPRYDRPLRLEVWYPAQLKAGQAELGTYTDVLGAGASNPARPNTAFTFEGRAVRDAQPLKDKKFPLVIVSHGYPGSRLQMSYLTEFLASHGYTVVAIDHTESTRADKAGFASTLLNRPLDILFVLDQITDWAKSGSGSPLAGKIDTRHTALLGYSMGGYGVLNAAGVGTSAVASRFVAGTALQARQAGNPDFEAVRDARIKALIAFAPWGGQQGLLDEKGLAGLRVPSLFIAGDQDDVAGYADGVRRLAEGAKNADRYLLVYENARHNIAPNPPPAAASSHPDDFSAYAEPVWDSSRINNINQHFVLAFLDQHLKSLDRQPWLTLVPRAADGKWSTDETGREKPDHSYWKGFKNRSALGLEFYHWPAQTTPSSTTE